MTAFAAIVIALLVGAAFCLRHQMICRKYNASPFNDHQRMVLCLAATSPEFTELLVGDFREAHFEAVAIHRAVAVTEHEIACIESIAPEEQSLLYAAVLSQLRERLAHLNLIAGNCDRRVAKFGGDLQLILQH